MSWSTAATYVFAASILSACATLVIVRSFFGNHNVNTDQGDDSDVS